jgi:hypothetical protein
MFILLESEIDIAKAQKTLERTLKQTLRQTAIKDVGYPGGRDRNVTVSTDGRYWFRSADFKGRRVVTPRRINWFGRLRESKGVGITVEVNISYRGVSGRAAGFFARNTRTGGVYLVHSGRVGGGKKGVGRNAFRVWSQEPLLEIATSTGRPRHGIIVMPIRGTGAGRLAVRYIELVHEFKDAVRSGETATRSFRRREKEFADFYSEPGGRRTRERASVVDYISRHGEIVDALHLWRRSRPRPENARLVKDIFIDMGVAIGGKLIELFEVKPSADRSSIYSGLGQLLVHGVARKCRLTLVLPHNEKLSNDLKEALTRHRVKILQFRLTSKKVEILSA